MNAVSSAEAIFAGTTKVDPKPTGKATIVGTEDWAGEKLAEFLKGRAYWLEASGRWIMWDGRKWNMEADSLLRHEALLCARKLTADGVERDDKAITGTLRARHSARGADAALKIARSRLIGDSINWNPDAHLLNCANGVIDLRTGRLLPHDPKYLMTMITPVPYLPDEDCPNFKAALKRFQPKRLVRRYLQMQYGYRATGEIGERAFFCQLGEGSNGKSTIENMFAKALGEYHAEAAGGLFLQSLNAVFAKDPSSHSEALFALRYKRNVLLKEPDNRHRLDESLLKQFTDGQGAVYRSRTLHKEGVDTPVTQKIVFYSNNPPQMSAAKSISRRLHALVWGVTLSKIEENPNFPSIFLVPELPGILAWIVEGAMMFYARGAKLGRPDFLTAGEEEYRRGSDPLADFLDRHVLREESAAGVSFAALYTRYAEFCEKAKVKPTGLNFMSKALAKHDLTVQVHHKDTLHPADKNKRLDKELRWIHRVTFMD